jgi:hypothetical protein
MTTKTDGKAAGRLEDHRSGAGGRSMAEQETIVRFDRTGGAAVLWTADLNQARRWQGRGYPVAPESGGWRCEVPKRAITFRSLAVVLAAGGGLEDGDESPEGLEDDDELARMMAEEAAS